MLETDDRQICNSHVLSGKKTETDEQNTSEIT